MHEYERVNWQDAPDKTTPLSAANLNNMDNGIAALYYDVGILEQLINQQSTQNASQMTVEYNQEDVDTDPGLQASGSSLQNFITGIHGRLQAIQAVIDSDPTHFQVANNLNTTQEGYVLDARQGSTISHYISDLRRNFTRYIENNSTASRDYSVGDYLYYLKKEVCRVTRAIQQGDDLVLEGTPGNANITSVAITDRIKNLERITDWEASENDINANVIQTQDYVIKANKTGRIVWVHGHYYLHEGVTSGRIATLPWSPVSPTSVPCQSDANGQYLSGYFNVDENGNMRVGTTWSGATRYSFMYLTNA